MKLLLLLTGWIVSFFIILTIELNNIVMYFNGCDDEFGIENYRNITILNIFIFITSILLINKFKSEIKENWTKYIGLSHIMITIFLINRMYDYLIFSTINGISPNIIFCFKGYDINEILTLEEFKRWQTNFLFIDRLYALLPIFFSFYYIYIDQNDLSILFEQAQCC